MQAPLSTLMTLWQVTANPLMSPVAGNASKVQLKGVNVSPGPGTESAGETALHSLLPH